MQVNNTQQQQKARRVLTTTAGPVATHIVVEESTVCTPENRFSKPRFSDILNLMNKIQLPFPYFTLDPDSS